MSVEFRNVTDLVVRDSEFDDAVVFGIWSGITPSGNVRVYNNRFQDIQSNAIFASFLTSATIAGNTFTHNHRSAIFTTSGCGGACPGGQIVIEDASGVVIDSNRIADGRIDARNTLGDVSGIEIGDGVRDTTITNNEITNNAGAGITANPGSAPQGLTIRNNRIYGNGLPFFNLSPYGISTVDNCLF